MKTIAISLLILLSLNISAFDVLKGCYKTLQIDGRDVVQGPVAENSETQVYTVENDYYRDLETQKRLDTMIISVFNGYRAPWYGFSNIVIPITKGNWDITQDVVKFQMDEDLLYINSNYQRSKVDFLIDATFKVIGDKLQADLYFSSIRRGIFYDFKVLLKREECL